MKTLIICIVLALFNPSVSKAVKLEDQTLDQQVEPRPMWPSFTDHSYIYLLGLFVNQRVSIFKHFFTVAEPAMFRAAIILSQKLNKTANGKQFAYRIEHTSGRDVIETLDLTCDAILENEILGIVGPEYSSEAKTLSRFANRAGLPVIGYSTTDPELSNRHAYHTFYRFPPSDVITVYALLKLFQKYNWNSTNVIYQSDNYGEGGLRALTEVFNKKINISRKIKYDLSIDEIDNLQGQLETSPSRIVVVWASVNVTTQIIQEALKAGNILAPRFLWILMSPNTTMLTADNQDVNQLSGMLMLRLVTSNLFDISIDTELLNNATDIWKEYDLESYPVDEKRIDTFALYAFDAAWLLILAIEKLCQQNPTTCLSYENNSSCFTSQLVNHEDLNKIIQTMNFTGVSGYVQFQSNTTDRVGSTMADYIIDNLQPLTKDSNKLQIVEVLRLNGTIMEIERDNEPQWEELDATISWPSHSPEPPTDYARLRDTSLKITVYISPPFFMMKPDRNNISQPHGYIHQLIELLRRRMNFNYTYIIASSEYSYNDLVENVKNNTYEIVAADLTITSSRTDKIDFSYPIYDNTMRLVVRKGKATEINPFAFLKPFHWKLWLLIVSIIYILPALLIALYELHEQKDNLRRQRISIKKNKCQYDTITTSLLRGFTFQSTTFYGHFQIIIVWLVGIILTALLTSNLIIYFKAQYEKPLLESIEDLEMCHKVSCDRIGIIEGSQHEEYFTNEVMKNESKLSYHRLKHPDECYAKLLDNHIDVAIADSSSADYFIQMPDYDRLQTTGPPFGKSYFGIAIPKQWPYKQDLDKNIMDLKLNGELDRLLSEWFQQKHYDREDNPYNNGLDGGMTIEETSGLFYIFGGLTGLNFIVFVSLYLYHWKKKAPAKAMIF